MSVELKDDSIKVKAALNDATVKFLYESAQVIQSQVKQNTAVDTGQLKASWNFTVDESKGEATIGSPVENAIEKEAGYMLMKKEGTLHEVKNPEECYIMLLRQNVPP